MDLTAETPVASTVHHPFGSPSGPGLFHVKGLQLPAYIQNVAHALQRSGKTESEAIQIAVGVVKRWATGIGAGGKKVHPDVQAAAARAVAEWEAAKARAHASSSSHANEAGGAVELGSYVAPHVPAGGPTGGQFGTTTGGGGGAGVSPDQALIAAAKAYGIAAANAKTAAASAAAAPKSAAKAKAAAVAAAKKAAAAKKVAAAKQVAAVKKAAAVKAAAAKKATAAAKKAAAKPAVKTAAAKAAVKTATPAVATPATPAVATKAPKVKATPGHPIVNKKKGTVTASINGKQVTTTLHEWHVVHVAHQQAVARQQAMKAGKKFAGDSDGRWLDLAFTEALAERVPPGRPDGGRSFFEQAVADALHGGVTC